MNSTAKTPAAIDPDTLRWYGYEPIAILPGIFKCVGFADRDAWGTAAMQARYPTILVLMGYRGDRITLRGNEWAEVTHAECEAARAAGYVIAHLNRKG